MPLSYGGGITTEQIKKIIGLGVEKVITISAEVVSNPNLLQMRLHMLDRKVLLP